MKKILFICLLPVSWISHHLVCSEEEEEQSTCYSTAFSAGYVFKNDCIFKEVYGLGVINTITADGCYYRWNPWGIGAKVSYWRANGCTTFLKCRTLLQEVPVTFYLRRLHDFNCGVQAYASLGGGFIWIKEKSYLGTVQRYRGIGEAEVGLFYSVCRSLNITAAFRYLFPAQSIYCDKAQVGGYDLRAGIAFLF